MRAASSLFAAIVFAAASAASAETSVHTNFVETFSTATGHWKNSSSFRSNRTWTTEGNVYGATGGARLGTRTATGSIVSESIPLRLADTEANLSIYVQAAGYPGQSSGILLLSALAENGDTIRQWTTNLTAANVNTETDLSDMESAASFDFTFDFTTSVPFKLSITTGNETSGDPRVLVGEVRVTETYETVEDPWAPVWTVGVPSPSPRVGAAFSFGVSAALADGTPQPVAFDGLTPVPTGTQSTYANGVFSWTPGMDDDGDYVAAFSVQNDGGTYSTNVAFTVRGATEEDELFFEGFSGINGTWGGTRFLNEEGDVPANLTDVDLWHGAKLYNAPSALRFGNGSNYGWIVSPLIPLKNGAQSAIVTVSFDACALQSTSPTIKFSVLDANGNAITGFAEQTLTLPVLSLSGDQSTLAQELADANKSGLSFTFTAPRSFRLKFDASSNSNGNVAIDSVRVTQTVSTSLVDLDVPTGLAVVDGTLSTNSFSVAWNGVANATNYTVEVREAGATEAVAAKRLASSPAAFAGLADDMVYEVRVRAEGDTSLYNFSAWTNLSVRTARSAAHATLSFGPWINAAGDGLLYAGITNAAAVSAVRDNGTNAVVTFTGVSPEPTVGPEFENGVLAWTPDDADTNKTFIVSFLLDGTYATNLSFKVRSVPFLQAPKAEAVDVAWNSFGLSWNRQLRAAGYAVRAWTDCPNPNATATRIEEDFAGYAAGVRPADWVFHCATGSSGFYKDDKAPVKLSESTHDLETYDLGGAISSVSFHAAGHSISNSTSTLTVVGIAADNTETVLATLSYSDIGQTGAGIDRTLSIPAGTDVRRIAWRYTKDKGGIGVGSVVIEGEGFSTPRWLPGWGPAEKDVGLVQSCTVKKPRPGKVLGVNPADKTKDLEAPRINYAEVTVRDAAGATLATVVAVKVPAPPRSARATLMILK